MSIGSGWTRLIAPVRRPIFGSLLRSKRNGTKRAHKAELQEWENEGGNLAPSPEGAEARVTTGSA